MAQRSVAEAGRVRLGTIYAAHGASHGFMLVLPAVLVALRAEFDASFTTLGTIATVSTMLYGLGALPAGLLADRAGAPVLLRVFAGVSAACCALAALTPGSGGSPRHWRCWAPPERSTTPPASPRSP
jgi:MFS family permease